MKNDKIIVTIEARMSSTRLPAKVLKPLAGAPMLQRIVERVKRAKNISRIILATTTNMVDDKIVELAKKLEINYFRGSEDDVLGRIVGTIKCFDADIVVALTGDNPLIDPVLIDDMVAYYFEGGYDYVSSTHMYHSDLWKAERSFPIGVSVQVIKASVLLEIAQETSDMSMREHGTFKIYHRCDNRYKLGDFQAEGSYADWKHPELRFTVDTPEDYELISRIYQKLYPHDPNFPTLKAIQLVLSDPILWSVNSDIKQKIAFQKG